MHATYSVESLLSEEELSNPGYDVFQFIYVMATPPRWNELDFDQPQDVVDGYATQFDYLKQGGKLALVPLMIGKAHATGTKILLCFGGQQEFLPLLENPDRIGSPSLSGIWYAWSKRTVTTASTWTGRSRWTRSCMLA